MLSFRPHNIYKYIKTNDIQSLEKNKNDLQYLIRDEKQITPLSSCIINCNNDVNQSKSKETLMFLLQNGGCNSIFVKGYMDESIVCTLPMACQPQSSVFNWPDPIKLNDDDVLTMIDTNFLSYLKTLSENSKNKKTSDNDITSSNSNVATIPLKPSFNHYPQTLNNGDHVRRGPNWSYGSQDEYNGVQCEGIVQTISGSYVQIEWLSDPSDPYSGFNNYQYNYNPPSRFDVYLVNPSDPKALPSNITAKALIAPIDRFKVGDRVQLKDDIQKSSLVPNSFGSSLSKFSDNCLGNSSQGRVGVIVSRSDEKRLLPNDSNSQSEFTVNVMAAHSGQIMEYSVHDLRYADGSLPGPFSDPPNPCIDDPQLRKQQKLSAGDKVKIRPDAIDRRGCLYEYTARFIGKITSVSGTRISVVCDDARKPGNAHIASIISGNYPHHTYNLSDLMSEFGDTEPLPLAAGDIVELSDTFLEPSGWCLGDLKDKRKGIVRFAPHCDVKDEQRDLYVQSLDDPKESFSFRSKWLTRSSNNGTTVFKVGDRVKLDIGNWKKKGATNGKCLGSAICGFYGTVVEIGPSRDGIQRNIGVVACSGDQKLQFSYYSSFHLVLAPRFAVLTDVDVTSLTTEVDQLLKAYSLSSIDALTEVKNQGMSVWSFLCSLVVIPKCSIMEVFERWDSCRSLDWPSDDQQGNHSFS